MTWDGTLTITAVSGQTGKVDINATGFDADAEQTENQAILWTTYDTTAFPTYARMLVTATHASEVTLLLLE